LIAKQLIYKIIICYIIALITIILRKFNFPIINKLLVDLPHKPAWLRIVILLLLIGWILPANAQFFELDSNRKHVTFPFRFVRNMIVIPVKINNKGPFNFILDTGVGLMIITEPALIDSINISSKRLIKIPGLGDGEDNEAYITSSLNVAVKGVKGRGVYAALLKKDYFNLSSYAGMPIHGLLGYEFFNSLAVKIDFGDSTITIYRPQNLHVFRKGTKIPISIEDRKPYLRANITFPNNKQSNCKLVIDIGAGHPMSIENMIKNYGLPKKFVSANLGVGLNGPINGFLSRVDEVDLGKYKIKNVLTSFPDSNSAVNPSSVTRDGNLGMGLLKRFDVIFDYPDSVLYLRPGDHYNETFEHDMSGLEYYATGVDYHHVIISRVEPGSAGDAVGLEKGDEIMSINFQSVEKMTLEDIDSIFKSRDDRSILLTIYHDKRYDTIILTLKRRI